MDDEGIWDQLNYITPK